MSRWRKESGHQQPCYWLCWTGSIRSPHVQAYDNNTPGLVLNDGETGWWRSSLLFNFLNCRWIQRYFNVKPICCVTKSVLLWWWMVPFWLHPTRLRLKAKLRKGIFEFCMTTNNILSGKLWYSKKTRLKIVGCVYGLSHWKCSLQVNIDLRSRHINGIPNVCSS